VSGQKKLHDTKAGSEPMAASMSASFAIRSKGPAESVVFIFPRLQNMGSSQGMQTGGACLVKIRCASRGKPDPHRQRRWEVVRE
jgi:hypothetical protein